MKFTKEEAFEKLKGILTNNGKKPLRMSEKSVNKQLETLIPLIATDDTELDDFVTKVKDTFSVMNSNAEKDNSDFVKQWEKEHPQTKPNEGGNGGQGNESKTEMEMVLERIKALENENETYKRQQTALQKKKELKSVLKEKGVKDAEWIDLMLQKVNVTDDFDTEDEADFYLKLYNKSNADTGGGVTPRQSSNGGTQVENPFQQVKELMKKRNIE
jgi:hypothetical protein